MHRRRHTVILALDPGTRHVGFAVFEGSSLVYHGVRTIQTRAPSRILRQGHVVVERMIRDFHPDVLAVEHSFRPRTETTVLLAALVREIQGIGRAAGLTVVSFAPSAVKKAMTGNGRASKQAVARAVASRYPELTNLLSEDRRWTERYHSNLFDAVAVGLAARTRWSPRPRG